MALRVPCGAPNSWFLLRFLEGNPLSRTYAKAALGPDPIGSCRLKENGRPPPNPTV